MHFHCINGFPRDTVSVLYLVFNYQYLLSSFTNRNDQIHYYLFVFQFVGHGITLTVFQFLLYSLLFIQVSISSPRLAVPNSNISCCLCKSFYYSDYWSQWHNFIMLMFIVIQLIFVLQWLLPYFTLFKYPPLQNTEILL